MSADLGWQPGTLARARSLMRRALRGALGARGEEAVHLAYHAGLRVIDRFDPPEDPATLAVLAAFAGRARTIVDIGANVGRYSWFLRRNAPADAAVTALEPHPGAARLLRRTLRSLAGATVLEVGASDRDATAELVVPAGAFGSPVSGLAWVRRGGDPGVERGTTIPIRRLDGLVSDGLITPIEPIFVKIDVEGGEAAVLRGATDLLKEHRPIVYLECQAASLARQGESSDAVWAELERHGYRLFANRSGSFVPTGTALDGVVNYLAVADWTSAGDGALDLIMLDAVVDRWATRRGPVAAPSAHAG